jgi:hypothetical protein
MRVGGFWAARSATTVVLVSAALLGAAVAQSGEGGSCKATTITNAGSAFTRDKAARNAGLSLLDVITALHPDYSRSMIASRIRIECTKDLLWHCTSSTTLCLPER